MPGKLTPVFLMSPPRLDWTPQSQSNFISSQTSHLGMIPRGAALRDWLQLADAIDAAGGEIVVVPAATDKLLTGMTYTAEAGYFVRKNGVKTFLLPNVTPAHRLAEANHFSEFFAGLGWEIIPCVEKWESQGDLFQVTNERWIHTYGVGQWGRTRSSAFDEIKGYFRGEQLHLAFKADPWFHGNTFFGVYEDAVTRTPHCLVCPDALVEGGFEKLRTFLGEIPVLTISAAESRRYVTNALQVNDAVIAPSEVSPEVEAFWVGLGLSPVKLEFKTLFGRGGGGGSLPY